MKTAAQLSKSFEDNSSNDPDSSEKLEDLANILRFLADAQSNKKDYSSAAANYQRALSIEEKNYAADPANAHVRDDLANTLAGAGMAAAASGLTAEAIKNFSRLIPITEDSVQKSPVNAVLRSRLAQRYVELAKICETVKASPVENSHKRRYH